MPEPPLKPLAQLSIQLPLIACAVFSPLRDVSVSKTPCVCRQSKESVKTRIKRRGTRIARAKTVARFLSRFTAYSPFLFGFALFISLFSSLRVCALCALTRQLTHKPAPYCRQSACNVRGVIVSCPFGAVGPPVHGVLAPLYL